MRALLSILLLFCIPTSSGSSSNSNNIRGGIKNSNDNLSDELLLLPSQQTLLRGSSSNPQQSHHRGRKLPEESDERRFFGRIFGGDGDDVDPPHEEEQEQQQVVVEQQVVEQRQQQQQQQQQQQHPWSHNTGSTFDSGSPSENNEDLFDTWLALQHQEGDTILTPEDQTIAAATALTPGVAAAHTPEGQSIAAATGVGGIGAGSVGISRPMKEPAVDAGEDREDTTEDTVAVTNPKETTSTTTTHENVEGDEYAAANTFGGDGDGEESGGISRPLAVPDSRPLTVGDSETVGFVEDLEDNAEGIFQTVSEGIASIGSFFTNGIRDSAESLVGSSAFCQVTGVCFGAEDAPDGDLPTPPGGDNSSPSDNNNPAPEANLPNMGDFQNANFFYKAFFWKTGSFLETPAWLNSFNQMMLCRTFGTCFEVPDNVAATLPDLEGDPYWRNRLCDVTNICFPTIAPTNAPTVTPMPTSAEEVTVTWPTATATAHHHNNQQQDTPMLNLQPEPEPEPEEVTLFGQRDPDVPIRCRFSPRC